MVRVNKKEQLDLRAKSHTEVIDVATNIIEHAVSESNVFDLEAEARIPRFALNGMCVVCWWFVVRCYPLHR